MSQSTFDCTQQYTDCSVDTSEFGQYPDIADKIFSIAFFTICAILQLVQGIKWQTWTYMLFTVTGSALEAIGYMGRLMLWANPLSTKGFEVQIICLVLAPAFLAAGVYLSLKQAVLTLGPEHSMIKPDYYTYAFIAADILSLVLQFVGGAIAGLGTLKSVGLRLALIGVVWQVVTLSIFGFFAIDYATRLSNNRRRLSDEARKTCRSWKFRLYAISITTTFLAILIRCIYRIPELTGGVRRIEVVDETRFIFLDGVMIVLADFCLTAFHPGLFLPRSTTSVKNMLQSPESPAFAENTRQSVNLCRIAERTPSGPI